MVKMKRETLLCNPIKMSVAAPPGVVDHHAEVKKKHAKVTGAELIELQRQFDTFDTDGSGAYVLEHTVVKWVLFRVVAACRDHGFYFDLVIPTGSTWTSYARC